MSSDNCSSAMVPPREHLSQLAHLKLQARVEEHILAQYTDSFLWLTGTKILTSNFSSFVFFIARFRLRVALRNASCLSFGSRKKSVERLARSSSSFTLPFFLLGATWHCRQKNTSYERVRPIMRLLCVSCRKYSAWQKRTRLLENACELEDAGIYGTDHKNFALYKNA